MRQFICLALIIGLPGCVTDNDPAEDDAAVTGEGGAGGTLDASPQADIGQPFGGAGGADAGQGGMDAGQGGADAGPERRDGFDPGQGGAGGGAFDAGQGGEGGEGGGFEVGAGGVGGDFGADPDPDLGFCFETGVCPEFGAPDLGIHEPPDRGRPDPDGEYRWLILFDDGSFDDGIGTTGVDFCGVRSDCGVPVAAVLILGDGSVCQAPGPGCATNRADPNAILDDGRACDPGSVPSDFVSIGSDGSIFVQFSESIAGCEVTVVELQGAAQEAYTAFVCDSDDIAEAFCVNNDNPVHEAAFGGEATFFVPAE